MATRDGKEPMTTKLESRWTADQIHFLRSWIGRMPRYEMAWVLGRSEAAVRTRIRCEKISIRAWLRETEYLTVLGVAAALGIDYKCAQAWMATAVQSTVVYIGNREIPAVRLGVVKKWVSDPMNWWRLDVSKVQHPELKTAVARARQKWDDEWLTAGEICSRYNYCQSIPNKFIKEGLRAWRWGPNWSFLRSDVEKFLKETGRR
jgi:hypothetical protein